MLAVLQSDPCHPQPKARSTLLGVLGQLWVLSILPDFSEVRGSFSFLV